MHKSRLLLVWEEENGEWILEALALYTSIYFTAVIVKIKGDIYVECSAHRRCLGTGRFAA